ncbi:Uncharacterised protein [Klebsiella pneumoniae]|uniref:hypothetical protein n=1 Tax=Klebsiella pneumoniae TaxID=573 RepID=UPI0007CCF80A|nr:hypothetical protein [Klebsiella pneumoniae]SAT92266.1 Uncharacterised protein [Klebsiella pneumoniae]
MTITLQTVNELIASLESSGELSIREQKFLKLAKAFKQLAAENVGMKSFGDKLNGMHNALNGEGTGIQGRAEVACQQVALEAAIEEFDAIETPATDRIVAEAEARGVEKAIAHLEKKFSNIGVQIMNLQWLADSLREGASE